MRDWVTNVDDTFYIIGTVAGPHPYPMLVRDFQSVIGRSAAQSLAQYGSCPTPWWPVSAAAPTPLALHPFLRAESAATYGVEAGGKGLETGEHADGRQSGRTHGNRTYLMQDDDGQILETHSVSVDRLSRCRPEHAWLDTPVRMSRRTTMRP